MSEAYLGGVTVEIRPGTTYELDREVLGRGGQAVIYNGTRVESGEQRALKVYREDSDLLFDDPTVDPVAAERAFLSRLNESDSPNVVRMRDSGLATYVLNGSKVTRPVLVMDRASYSFDKIDPKQMTPPRALNLLEDAAVALDGVHRRGVIHRDVKPSNFLATGPDERARLTDFATAKDVSSPELDDLPVGSLAYMAPETILGGVTNTKTDAYQYMLMAFEMINHGGPPFPLDEGAQVIDWQRWHQSKSHAPVPFFEKDAVHKAMYRVFVGALAVKNRSLNSSNALEAYESLYNAYRFGMDCMPKIVSLSSAVGRVAALSL